MNIKDRLAEHLTMSKFASAYELTQEALRQRAEAADHIEAQERRIAELSDYLDTANAALHATLSQQAPANAIDAERYRAFRNASIAEDMRFIDAMDDVIDRHTDDTMTIELFDAAIDAAMKAAK